MSPAVRCARPRTCSKWPAWGSNRSSIVPTWRPITCSKSTPDGKRISEKSRVQLEAGSGVTLYVGESGSVSTLVPKTVGLHLQQAKSRLWELGLNIGKISFDEGINLLNQREARVYLADAFGRAAVPRLGAKVDLKLTLDAAKVTAQSAAADKEMIKAAEELRRLDAETADSLARGSSGQSGQPSRRSGAGHRRRAFPGRRDQRKTNFSNNAHSVR